MDSHQTEAVVSDSVQMQLLNLCSVHLAFTFFAETLLLDKREGRFFAEQVTQP